MSMILTRRVVINAYPLESRPTIILGIDMANINDGQP
jgi:hypothetical protein